MASDTLPGLVQALVSGDPSRPLVTFYDDATGERVELSVATFANWVAKTACLAQDELGLEHGDTVLVDLPTHWLGAVWLYAAWSAGLTVTASPGPAPDLVVCGPDSLDSHAGSDQVVALSLRPLGARFDRELPGSVVDFAAVVLGQPDAFHCVDPPGAEDVAWQGPGGSRTHGGLLDAVREEPLVTPGGRLLTDRNPCSENGLPAVVSPLAAGGSVVLVANPDPTSWSTRQEAERATAVLRD